MTPARRVRLRESPLAHLAYAIWLNHDPRRCHMAMFTLYSDASGHPVDAPVLFVSGFVSKVDKWLKFDDQWTDLLTAYGITPPFRMSEFAGGYGQYARWKDDRPKRRAFLTEAFSVIKRHTQKPFSVGISVNDLKSMRQEYETPSIYAYPFTACALILLKQVSTWEKKHTKPGDRIRYVFEDGDEDKHILVQEMRQLFYGQINPIFEKKENITAFQAGDFLAWQHARLAKVALGQSTWGDVLDVFAAKHNQLPDPESWAFIDKEVMLRTANRKGWPRKRRGRP